MQFYSLNQIPLYTDDFFFTGWTDSRNKDAIVIFNPQDAMIVSPVFLRSRKTLEEHIKYIRNNNIKKAIIVADNIEFLKDCPSLEYLKVYPSISAVDFDYSPVYQLPNLRALQCETMYGLKATYDVDEDVKISKIDYSRFKNLKMLTINGVEGHLNTNQAGDIVSLYFDSGFPGTKTLTGSIPNKALEYFTICQSSVCSLEGIEDASKLCWLELSYNRHLTDISALKYLSNSLKYLDIQMCGKIRDFSVLCELHNLEFLTLRGTNSLQNLSFLKEMPKLKNFHLTMNVADGNLSLCEKVPYVTIQNRRHYSHKDKDLPKQFTNPPEFNQFI